MTFLLYSLILSVDQCLCILAFLPDLVAVVMALASIRGAGSAVPAVREAGGPSITGAGSPEDASVDFLRFLV